MRLLAHVILLVSLTLLLHAQPAVVTPDSLAVPEMATYNGDNGGALIAALRDRITRAAGWDMYDKPIPRN